VDSGGKGGGGSIAIPKKHGPPVSLNNSPVLARKRRKASWGTREVEK